MLNYDSNESMTQQELMEELGITDEELDAIEVEID